MSDVDALYDEDFAAWARQQAKALRAAARGGANQVLDWKHLAEEIEDLGDSDRSMIASHLMGIIQHLVKLEFSPAIDPRRGWRRSIRLARLQIERRLERNPSLKRELGGMIEAETKRGIALSISDLEEYQELDEIGAIAVRRSRYTQEQVLGDWFPPEPAEDSGAKP